MILLPRNVVLLAVFAVLLALYLVLERPAPRELEDRPVFPGLTLEGAATVRLGAPRGSAEGGRVELVRSGAGWTVTERGGFPAHAWAVERLLNGLSALRTVDRVSTEADSHGRFGVDESGRRVAVLDARGALLASLVAGTASGPGLDDLPAAARPVYAPPSGRA